MRVRALGPLEISDGGASHRVGAAKPRALLAALVVRDGSPVSVPRLIEELWGDSPPATAVNVVQGYVAGLRRSLGDPTGQLLRTQPPGYQLVLADEDLDVQRFENLIERGRKEVASDRAAASDLLAEAHQLWRGQPFADVPATDAVEAEASRLEQLRLAALEIRIEADLELGRHAELIPELQTLTRTYPLMERFWAELMLALYRSGRQADALTAYQRLYKLLDDELGVEPTTPVRELHQQILTGDPALDVAPPNRDRTTGEETLVPRQLPAPIGDFTGRTAQLAQLDALLPGDGMQLPPAVVLVTIAGSAGVGKTALAIHWAHRIADGFPDGQLYVNLRGFDPSREPVGLAEALHGFLEALGVAPKRLPVGLDASAALYRSLMASKRMLIVLDNAIDEDQVRPLLPASAGSLVLTTSRNELPGLVAAQAAKPLVLTHLSDVEAHQLLTRRVGEDRVAAEPQAGERILARCAGLPLALAIVAARAATHPGLPLHALAAELDGSRTTLDPFTGRDITTNLRAVFSWSYRQLDRDAQQLFRSLGLHPGPDISAPAAASLTGQPLAAVQRLLSELCRANLLLEHVPGRYAFHDLLRAYASELTHTLDRDADQRAAEIRLLDHYLHTARAAASLYNSSQMSIDIAAASPGVVPESLHNADQAQAWFRTEQSVLSGLIRLARDRELDTYAWQLSWTLIEFLNRQGHWSRQLAIQQIGLEAAERLADPVGQMRSRRCLAFVYIQLERYGEADLSLSEALDIARTIGEPTEQAMAHTGLAVVAERQGRIDVALEQSSLCEELVRDTGDSVMYANAISNLGWYSALAGDCEVAVECCHRALPLLEELDDPHGLATTQDTLGYAYHHLGRHDEAIAYYQRALPAARAAGDRHVEASILDHIGDHHAAIGDHDSAYDNWRQALAIFEELAHHDAEKIRAKLTAPA